jgi:hypothetical protein
VQIAKAQFRKDEICFKGIASSLFHREARISDSLEGDSED